MKTTSPSAIGTPDGLHLETLVDAFLAEQRQLSAVERFSQRHADAARPLLDTHYRALMPATPPGPGEQYAFEVDLDQCSSCKACVVACHSLNGLDSGESWREIRLLVGSRPPTASAARAEPVALAVTAACHHCVDPGCLKGCPVLAYDKDPVTGIVRHLDDQCIGCSYCIFTCPYEVPKFSESRGIVRKCDLCHGRLEVGEAPACVQACPNEAIRITRVSVNATLDRYRGEEAGGDPGEAGCALPGMPSAAITVPTTVYRSRYPLAGLESRPVSGSSGHREAHWPLIAMLVLTQWGGGILAAVALKAGLADGTPTVRDAGVAALGCLGVQGGLMASVFHLGRPLQAWRIGLGWRTSWLSREAIALGVFSAVSVLFTALLAAAAGFPAWPIPGPVLPGTAVALLLLLFVATLAQVQVYAVTGRVPWRLGRTVPRFAGTVLMGFGVGCGLLMATNLLPALGLLLMGFSVMERWQFFTGGSVADAVSRDGGVR